MTLLAAACAGAPPPGGVTVVDDTGRTRKLHGAAPGRALAKPALHLVDTAGRPFDLRQRTSGKVTFVYFGYTNCPDVCPTTMSDLAAALREVDASVRSDVAVVFVTVDPDRDTPAVLARWLGQFDPTFVGVTGPLDRIRAEADAFGVEIADPAPLYEGVYNVTHGAQVTVFTKDGRDRVAYPAGTLVEDYLHDLPILAAVGAMT
jgi:protein SCO1/2